jgi:LysM repeat protein
MFSISRDHGIQLDKLYDKNLMKPGMEPATGEILDLRETRDSIPKLADDTAADKKSIAAPAPRAPKQFYTVSKGDTLYSISKKYNVSVDELKQLNELASSNLQVGTKLRVK